MTTDTAALVRQLRDALDDARDDVQVELVMCQQRAGYPSTDRELAYQIDIARRVDDAIAAADAWLSQQRGPLTDGQINRMACIAGFSPVAVVTDGGSFGRFARAIERANGIGEEGGAA